MVGTWLGEIRSCPCLAVLPDTAWVLLNKIYQPFFTSLYMLGTRLPQLFPKRDKEKGFREIHRAIIVN